MGDNLKMKKVIAITLFLTLLILGLSSEDNVSTDLPDLIEEIEKLTNGNWKIEHGNREYILLRYKKEIMGFEHYVSGPRQREPKAFFYEFYLYITPKIGPENFNEFRKEAKDTFDNLKIKALEQIKYTEGKGLYTFYPNNKKEWELYLRYLKAEKVYRDIPEYYYKNIGIISRKYKQTRAESKDQKEILKNAEEQEQEILKLLTRYRI